MDQRRLRQQEFPIYIDIDEDKIVEQIIKTIIQRQVEEFERRYFVKRDEV